MKTPTLLLLIATHCFTVFAAYSYDERRRIIHHHHKRHANSLSTVCPHSNQSVQVHVRTHTYFIIYIIRNQTENDRKVFIKNTKSKITHYLLVLSPYFLKTFYNNSTLLLLTPSLSLTLSLSQG